MGGPTISWLPSFINQFPEAERYRGQIEGVWELYVEESNAALEMEEELSQLRTQLERYKKDEETFENQRKFYQGILHDHLETSVAYANLIISAGYAGLFASWTLTIDNLSPVQSALVGGLALLSLLFFVGWEIAKMVYGAWDARRYAQLLAKQGAALGPAHLDLDRRQEEAERLFGRWWIVAVLGALLPGLSAGLILAGLLWVRVVSLV